MPPRLPSIYYPRLKQPLQPTPAFLLPFLHTSSSPAHLPYTRPASILSSLRDNPGAFRTKKRLGRGPSSGKGKTSGRGHKGQKQHGKVPSGMTGGQTPLSVTHPPKGVANKNFEIDLTTLNLSKLVTWISQGRIDPARPITIRELKQSRCVSSVKDGVKLLARGLEDLKVPINIVVSRASAAAITAIENAGGSVFTRYYTNFAIRRIMEGKMDPVNSLQSAFPEGVALAAGRGYGGGGRDDVEGVEDSGRGSEIRQYLYRLPDPSGRKDIEYYRDPAHRGYLAHTVPEGHGPSLYFRTPGVGAKVGRKVEQGKKKTAGNKMW